MPLRCAVMQRMQLWTSLSLACAIASQLGAGVGAAQSPTPAPLAPEAGPPSSELPIAPPAAAPVDPETPPAAAPSPAQEALPPTAAAGPAPAGPEEPNPAADAVVEPLAPLGESSYGATAVAPGPYTGIALDDVPRNVQQVDGAWIAGRHVIGFHEALNMRLSSVTINEAQHNPLQPDLQFRGFTASPLLGTPQGLAVYQNGVRINEPFGDVLQWDLIPTFALAEAELLPGANPIYGLNALGGSLVLRMKDGFRAPGYRVSALAGSFARYQASLEYGRAFGDWAVYAGASMFGEQGFRDYSPSRAENLFVDLRHRTPKREAGVSLTMANTSLHGNGPAPIELLERDRSAVFTWPDITENQLFMVNFDARQELGKRAALLGTLYLRHGQRATLNGDAAEFELCSPNPDESVLCDEEGEVLLDEALRPIPTEEPFDALFNTTDTTSDGAGGSLQVDLRERLLSRPNRFVSGVSYDGASSQFLQRAQLGFLTESRGVQGAGIYLSGAEFATDLHVRDHNVGVYVSDTWTVVDPLAINLGARMNWYQTSLDDRAGDALDGEHVYLRVNPTIGATFGLVDGLLLFASYGESNRAPSASELACADPDEPCRVPNAFLSDPPLEQVVSRSVELGLRGRLGSPRHPWLQASLAGFGTRNQDDILFVAGSRVGTGYFRNAGETQRIGLELAVTLEAEPISFYAGYTLLRATFESELELPAGAHPSFDEGDDDDATDVLEVEAGSRMPGLPTHSVKGGVAVRPRPELEIGLSMTGQSSQPFRGDEANLLDEVAGFVVMHAHLSYQLFPELQLFVRANNLFDAEYATFGVLGEPSDALPGTSDPRFYGPAAPFGIWAGAVLAEVP